MKCTALFAALGIGLLQMAGCADHRQLPSLEVMRTSFGIVVTAADGSATFVKTNFVPLRPGQIYGWYIDVRTNLEKVQYVEQVALAGPAQWPAGGDAQISADRRTITVRHEAAPVNGIISGEWKINADDPPGRATITVKLENEVVQRFDFELLNR